MFALNFIKMLQFIRLLVLLVVEGFFCVKMMWKHLRTPSYAPDERILHQKFDYIDLRPAREYMDMSPLRMKG
jgi:hypothetical protein